ncbi:MAG: biopolymer transporter ExbD, partial [Chlorobia bacterium]|nr:biopolymer transporter ExbD [Fimbriimonadaceae bacterium]
MKFKRRTELKRTKIEIIPMVDTMFFLLVFFMLSSLALSKLVAMPVDLPKAGSAQRVQEDNNLALSVDSAGQIYLDRQPVSVSGLGDVIKTVARNRKLSELTLVINADEKASHGLVVQCIDEARL